MQVVIDSKSGFCFGVKKVIALAESELKAGNDFYCLGDIVHNEEEVARLEKLGMKVINHNQLKEIQNCKVLIRAHGEPPVTYKLAEKNNIELIEGTCPVVLKLQEKIRKKNEELQPGGTIIIFGKPNHPEVSGLNGQINNNAVVVQNTEDLGKIDFTKPVKLFAQTTMNKEKYQLLRAELEKRLVNPDLLETCDSICGQVANRGPWLEKFSKKFDAVVFVGGKKSSNSKVLFSHCLKTNSNSFFVSSANEVSLLKLDDFETIGVCGATSTPQWLMENIATCIENNYKHGQTL